MAFPINPEVFHEAYRKTGVKASDAGWFQRSPDGAVACCPIGALLCSALGTEETERICNVDGIECEDAARILTEHGHPITEDQLEKFVNSYDLADIYEDDEEAKEDLKEDLAEMDESQAAGCLMKIELMRAAASRR